MHNLVDLGETTTELRLGHCRQSHSNVSRVLDAEARRCRTCVGHRSRRSGIFALTIAVHGSQREAAKSLNFTMESPKRVHRKSDKSQNGDADLSVVQMISRS